MRYTLGNLSDNIPGPTSPTKLNQLITVNPPLANNKFTAHGAVADTKTGPVGMNIPFAKSYIIRQTAKGGGAGGVKHSFVNSSGSVLGTPGHDQDAPASITKAQYDAAGGDGHVFWQAEYLKAGDYSFQGGAG